MLQRGVPWRILSDMLAVGRCHIQPGVASALAQLPKCKGIVLRLRLLIRAHTVGLAASNATWPFVPTDPWSIRWSTRVIIPWVSRGSTIPTMVHTDMGWPSEPQQHGVPAPLRHCRGASRRAQAPAQCPLLRDVDRARNWASIQTSWPMRNGLCCGTVHREPAQPFSRAANQSNITPWGISMARKARSAPATRAVRLPLRPRNARVHAGTVTFQRPKFRWHGRFVAAYRGERSLELARPPLLATLYTVPNLPWPNHCPKRRLYFFFSTSRTCGYRVQVPRVTTRERFAIGARPGTHCVVRWAPNALKSNSHTAQAAILAVSIARV